MEFIRGNIIQYFSENYIVILNNLRDSKMKYEVNILRYYEQYKHALLLLKGAISGYEVSFNLYCDLSYFPAEY